MTKLQGQADVRSAAIADLIANLELSPLTARMAVDTVLLRVEQAHPVRRKRPEKKVAM